MKKLFKKGHDMKMHMVIGLGILAGLWLLNKTQAWIEMPTGNDFSLGWEKDWKVF